MIIRSSERARHDGPWLGRSRKVLSCEWVWNNTGLECEKFAQTNKQTNNLGVEYDQASAQILKFVSNLLQ